MWEYAQRFDNESLKIWKYLKEKIGLGSDAELDADYIDVNLCTLKMPNIEHFAKWSTAFESKAKLCKAHELF